MPASEVSRNVSVRVRSQPERQRAEVKSQPGRQRVGLRSQPERQRVGVRSQPGRQRAGVRSQPGRQRVESEVSRNVSMSASEVSPVCRKPPPLGYSAGEAAESRRGSVSNVQPCGAAALQDHWLEAGG